MPAPVLLPARLVRLRAERLLLAEADSLDPVRRNSSCNQSILHRAGTIVTERKVVLGRPTLVAVSLNGEADIGMLLQEGNIRL